jgi:cytochrome c oxidase subunit 2
MKLFNERGARLFLLMVVMGLILVVVAVRWLDTRQVVEVHAAMPEKGGWSPENLAVEVGEPLQLRLVSDDVLHGFAIGQQDDSEIELKPGQPVETTLVFDRPGKYVYYCTRWCGVNHWRMRGTIEVSGPAENKKLQSPPLYVTLGLDLDVEHHADNTPQQTPSAGRGAALAANIPDAYLALEYYQTHSPAEVWDALRDEPELESLDDGQIWDLVAYIWSTHTSSAALADGERLYANNCAACHGERGGGDGVMAEALDTHPGEENHASPDEAHDQVGGHDTTAPTDFTDPAHMLGASPALLHGKTVRGGMGTGMPYWGPIFTDEQIWNLVSYLYTYQFEQLEVDP